MTELVENPQDRVRLLTIKRELREGESRAAAEIWRRGALLREVERDALWRHDGAASMEAWLSDELDLDPMQAWRATTIARHFTEEMATRFGSRKLLATVAYLSATRREEQPGDVLALTFRFRLPTGRYDKVPFLKATARQIEQAATELRANQRARAAAEREKAIPEGLKARAAELTERLPKSLQAGAAPAVKLKARKDGTVLVDVTAVPLSDLRATAQTLVDWADENGG